MLALCLMLLVTYHALNYAGIIGLGLLTYLEFNHGNHFQGDLFWPIITVTKGQNTNYYLMVSMTTMGLP